MSSSPWQPIPSCRCPNVGSQGRHQNDYRAINLPPASALPALVASGGTGLNQQVQYLGFGGIRLSENEANSHYNSFQTGWGSSHCLSANDLRSDLAPGFGNVHGELLLSLLDNGCQAENRI